MSVHAYPLNDILDHETDGNDCHCDPRIEWIDEDTGLPFDDAPLVVHNSYDQRER